MKKFRFLTTLILTIGLVLSSVQSVLAVPPIPSGFWGTVKVNGANVPPDMVVSAKINGIQYASTSVITYEGVTYYSLDIPGDDLDTQGVIEGGVEGNTIVFFIGTIQAAQTATWHSGTFVSFNLSGVGQVIWHIYLPLIRR